MLKSGKVVALDTTNALLKRVAGSQLKLRLSGAPIPSSLHAIQIPHESAYTLFRINQSSEIEPILASLRVAGCAIDEMHLEQADLEDVFIQIMGDAKK
jgi:ABC-2 type transport system ATP-binding protein